MTTPIDPAQYQAFLNFQAQQAAPAPAPVHFNQPAQPQTPQPAPVQASLTDFYNQPSSGSKSWSWKDKPIGTSYAGIVERAVHQGDIKQDTDISTGAPATYKDGRPKLTMWVPMLVTPDQMYPEGKASWPVNSSVRDELARAMAAAGVPDGVTTPEPGAGIRVTLTNRVPTRFPQPRNVITVEYIRPDGAASAPAPVVEQAQPVQVPVAAPVVAPVPVVQAAPVVQPATSLAAPEGMSPEKAALLAKLSAGKAA